MNIRVIAVGKIRERYTAQAIDDFRRRLRPYHALEIVEVKASDGSNPAAAVAQESQRIIKMLDANETVWLLERTGTQLTSRELSQQISELAGRGRGRLTLIVAGTYGASAELQERAQFLWSLSPLTFLHEWARAIVLEQLYRAAKIARNEPYHH